MTQANNRKRTFSEGSQVSTVDSFQGEENEFVFVDIVVAHQGSPQEHTGADAEDSEDDSPEVFKRSGRVTAHVKSPNRLCCALTRGRSCVVVVCQLAAILGTVKKSRLKASASVSCMARTFGIASWCLTITQVWTPAGLAKRCMRPGIRQSLNLSCIGRVWRTAACSALSGQRPTKALFTNESRDAAFRVYRIQEDNSA